MGPALKEKRDNMLTKAIVAPADQFDAVYDAGMQDYLKSGGQAIIDERKAKYEAAFGK
jgi:putative aldouronate transport system substrate-binding protein